MKEILDWQTREVVDIYDEVNLWSAPFGRLLLENIPMKARATVADIGFGTGFPLIELGQRFGEDSTIYGIDVWTEAIKRTRRKIETLGLTNIEILEGSATRIGIDDQQIDLITSNLGANNFDQREVVYSEINRILRPDGRLCITTNPIGTFNELFELFETVLKEMELNDELSSLEEAVLRRNTKEGIIAEFEDHGFALSRSVSDTTNMRFVNAQALLDHSLIRIGFREYWASMIREEQRADFFERLVSKIKQVIQSQGVFKMTIPMLYLEFEKA